MKAKEEHRELKVRHIMADGEIRDSVKGVVVPADCEIYALLGEMARRRRQEAAAKRPAL